MSSTRTAPRTTSNSKTTSVNTHHTNGLVNAYDINESPSNLTYPTGNNPEFDPNLPRSSLKRNISQYDGIYRNARFIHAISSGLVGQQVVIQTSDHERFHGVLETLSPNADIVLTVSHRLDKNNNDIITTPTLPIDLIDTIDSSSQTFELHKRIIKAINIVEIIAVDVDLSANAKCSLDENPKVSQVEDDRFSRMEHFYGSDEIDPETLEDLEVGDDGKAGFDPEDMFHTNREKFNTTTDFDESKYTNVPIRQMSATELAEIEKKIQEIEKGVRTEDIDEDDAGVKRPTESHNLDDRNSNIKNNRSNRNEFRYDNEYNPSKRDNWREQRFTGNNSNRRGGGGNNPKQNQYISTNNRQQYNNRIPRNNRFTDRSPHQGRDSPAQTTNEDSAHHNQRISSGSFSHGQSSVPTSPSAIVSARTIYPSTNRSSTNQNSPTQYAGSSSSRTNSITATSPSPNQQLGTNKMAKKSSLNEQQSVHDETDQPKQQRSSNNQTNTTPLNRPSHLQSKQQSGSTNNNNNNNNNIQSPSTYPNQDDHSSSHDIVNSNQSSTPGTATPNSTRSNAALNPEADEFVPVFSRESSSRPESRGASTASSTSMNAFIPHPHPQALHFLQQQQQQQAQSQQTPPIIPVSHTQNAAALYQHYYQTAFANMPQFINATPQQMTVGVMSAPMMSSQPLIATGPNTNNSSNGSSSGMTTPNSSVSAGPTYKINNNNINTNQVHSGDNVTSGVNNVASKKAVVSVQRPEQSNIPQQQVPGVPPMVFSAPPIRYYSPDYLAQQATPTSMHLQQIPFYYSVNSSGMIQAAAAVGQHQNIMIPSTSSSTGSSTPVMPPLHYAGVYADPRMYSLYSSAAAAAVNPASVHPNWQLARSPPQQQQQQPTDQQRGYGNGQNAASQPTPSTGTTNIGGRSASISGQSGTVNSTSGSLTPQYTINGTLPATYAYGGPAGWISGPQQVPPLQTNISPQINAAYNIMFDPSQQVPPQQAAYLHRNPYDTPLYFSQPGQPQPPPPQQQQQQQQQPPPQTGLDTVPQGNYNR
ncbi:unnamed protein product [Rotaria sp. Silwood1]|nr:unnamed protein product [Rotaria sp. Silwood1]CAF3424280.1 unnamed protein product [Rotaria sp. Silwood1]CAF4593585.1 unnamed protein product [Rotaria sp. Silwood1]CAF4707721.1 unnamed protein product [Rotaria sp. Silwood1]